MGNKRKMGNTQDIGKHKNTGTNGDYGKINYMVYWKTEDYGKKEKNWEYWECGDNNILAILRTCKIKRMENKENENYLGIWEYWKTEIVEE